MRVHVYTVSLLAVNLSSAMASLLTCTPCMDWGNSHKGLPGEKED